METIFQSEDIILKKENTLVLGAEIKTKNKILNELSNSCSIVDNSFLFSTKSVGETIENYNIDLKPLASFSHKLISNLKLEEYYYLAIILKISSNPGVLIIDNLFGYLNNNQIKNILNICKKKDIILVIFDNEFYQELISYKVMVIHNGKLAIKGPFKEVVKEEKILKRLGYKLPFYVDLSMQLKLYGLVGNVCYSLEELEAKLWN